MIHSRPFLIVVTFPIRSVIGDCWSKWLFSFSFRFISKLKFVTQCWILIQPDGFLHPFFSIKHCRTNNIRYVTYPLYKKSIKKAFIKQSMLFWHTYKFNNGRYYRFLQIDQRLNVHPDVQKMYKFSWKLWQNWVPVHVLWIQKQCSWKGYVYCKLNIKNRSRM